jgi:hypothetical protein
MWTIYGGKSKIHNILSNQLFNPYNRKIYACTLKKTWSNLLICLHFVSGKITLLSTRSPQQNTLMSKCMNTYLQIFTLIASKCYIYAYFSKMNCVYPDLPLRQDRCIHFSKTGSTSACDPFWPITSSGLAALLFPASRPLLSPYYVRNLWITEKFMVYQPFWWTERFFYQFSVIANHGVTMSHPNPAGNGCSLEDCYTNLFALVR